MPVSQMFEGEINARNGRAVQTQIDAVTEPQKNSRGAPSQSQGRHPLQVNLQASSAQGYQAELSSPGWYSPLRSTGNFQYDSTGGRRLDFKQHVENL